MTTLPNGQKSMEEASSSRGWNREGYLSYGSEIILMVAWYAAYLG